MRGAKLANKWFKSLVRSLGRAKARPLTKRYTSKGRVDVSKFS